MFERILCLLCIFIWPYLSDSLVGTNSGINLHERHVIRCVKRPCSSAVPHCVSVIDQFPRRESWIDLKGCFSLGYARLLVSQRSMSRRSSSKVALSQPHHCTSREHSWSAQTLQGASLVKTLLAHDGREHAALDSHLVLLEFCAMTRYSITYSY